MKLTYTALSALLISLCVAGGASADDNKVAYDKNDNVLTNTFNNCVRTKWDGPEDICSQAPAPAPAPVAVAPAPVPAGPIINREARTIYFDFNKTNLTADAITKLNTLVAHVARSRTIKGVGIAGFADRIGSNDYNQALSEKRAKRVYNYLSSRVNIPTQIVDMQARGETAPITTCADSLSRSEKVNCLQGDRRVEVLFVYEE